MPISGIASTASPVSNEPTQRSFSRANTVAAWLSCSSMT